MGIIRKCSLSKSEKVLLDYTVRTPLILPNSFHVPLALRRASWPSRYFIILRVFDDRAPMRKHAIPLAQVGYFTPNKARSIKFERASDPHGVVGIRVHTHIARADGFVAMRMSGKWSSMVA